MPASSPPSGPTLPTFPALPVSQAGLTETSRAALDAAVAALQAQKTAWSAVGVRERLALLDRLTRDTLAVAGRWSAACMAAEDLDPGHPSSGEEALVGPYFLLRNLRLLRKSLRGIELIGRPWIPGPVTTRPNGQVTARIFPQDVWDRTFYPGVTADVWMEPGVSALDLAATQALAYRRRGGAGGVALVLGAGNVSSIGPMDALSKLFIDDRVVLYKVHPVNAYLEPLFAEAFRALIEPGYLRQVAGGAEVGAYLCAHQGIDEIHITGSDKTYEAIVFGLGSEGEERKRTRRPRLTKPVTAELGNVSPVIVVPGPWSAGDIAYHAENLVSMLTNNAGFNCNATRVIVTHGGWDSREPLLAAVRKMLAAVPPRKPWYPGAEQRFARFLRDHSEAELFGEGGRDRLPWALIPGLDAERRDDLCFTVEAFCGLFGELPLAAADPAAFLDRAVDFCNDTLWGTLNATLLVHPKSLADPRLARAFESAVERLRYGTISLNHWAAVGYGLVVPPWGGFPGQPPEDIQSGAGWVHNTLMFSRPQKTVVRAPFRVRPKPVWFATHRTAHRLTPKLSAFEASPSPAKLPGIFSLALMG